MSSNLTEVLRVALNNNSYDYDSMHKILKKTWENSYSYLYTLQKSYVKYEEIFYRTNNANSRNVTTLGMLYMDKLQKPCIDLNYDMIEVHNREEYYTSKFYNQYVTPEEMYENPSIFSMIPIVIVDNQVIWDYTLKVLNDGTTIRFPSFDETFVKASENSHERPISVGDKFLITNNLEAYATFSTTGTLKRIKEKELPARLQTLMDVIRVNRQKGKKLNEIPELEIRRVISYFYNIKEWTENRIVVQMETEDFVYKDHEFQILMIDNEYYQRISLNTYTIKLNRNDNTIRIHKDYLQKNPEMTGIMFCSLHFPNNSGRGYELGTGLIQLEKDGNYYVGKLTNSQAQDVYNMNSDFYISLVFIKDLEQHTFYGNKKSIIYDGKIGNLFVLQQAENVPYKMPIPTENLMVFKQEYGKDDGYHLIKNNDSIILHYPNIYELNDINGKKNDEYKIFYFYHDGYDLNYIPLFDFYYSYLATAFDLPLEEVLDRVYRGKLFYEYKMTKAEYNEFTETMKYMLSYNNYNHQYADVDFIHRYLPLPENDKKTPTEYKIETLKEWVKVQRHPLKEYVIEQKKRGQSLFLFTNTMDITTRLRNDISQEFPTETHVFPEPMYVFGLANRLPQGQHLEIRVFVDGLSILPFQKRKNFMEYIYIPASMVTRDSFIEVEQLPTIEFSKDIKFTSMDDSTTISIIEPDENIIPTTADMVYVDNNKPHTDVDYNIFTINTVYDDCDYEVRSDDPDKPIKFTRLVNFKISPNSVEALNKNYTLHITKIPMRIVVNMVKDGYPYIAFPNGVYQFSKEYIRVFHNGRMVPQSHYDFFSSYNNPRVRLCDLCKKGDMVIIDITPYRYREVYYQQDLNPRQLVIDLKNYINKPFSIKYFDVYVNGRKLNINSVMDVDAWSMTMVNLKSLHNLLIMEKERDWEYFGLDYKEGLYYFNIEDLLKKGFVTEDEKNRILKEIIDKQKDPRLKIKPNEDNEEILEFGPINPNFKDMELFYFNELIPMQFVDPDYNRFNNVDMEVEYPIITENFRVTPSDQSRNNEEKERRKNYPNTLILNPDHELAGSIRNDAQSVYSVGHPNKVDQKYLDETVTIVKDNPINK